MSVRKFRGSNSREVLGEIRRTMGEDAVVLSNRKVDGGVEITALGPEALAELVPEAGRAKSPRKPFAARAAEAAEEHPFRTGRVEPRTGLMHEQRPAAVRHAPLMVERAAGAGRDERGIYDQRDVRGAQDTQARRDERSDEWGMHLMSEIKALRGSMEQQLAGMAWNDMQQREPVRARLLRELLAVGFSPFLARAMVDGLPAGTEYAQAMSWAQGVLARNLAAANEDEIVMRGGVYALVGPTGVGKTTTLAKLAARCVVRHGAERLALLTTDSYRVGAHEQLRIYGKILGVPVHAVRDGDDLRVRLAELGQKHMVLIDTMGMGQRDEQVPEQTAMLTACGVKRLLLLAAAGSADQAEDVVRAYRGGAGDGLHGAIITKLDEAVNIGGALDITLRHKLKLHYVTNGQRVPEDLHPARRDVLAHRALRVRPEAAAAAEAAESVMPYLLNLRPQAPSETSFA